MPDNGEIGAISIGISANTSQLKKSLGDIRDTVARFTVPTIKFKVEVREPTPADIAKAGRNIENTIKKVQSLKIDLAPRISAKTVSITAFRTELQAALEGKPVKLDVKPNDVRGFRDAIKAGVGTVPIAIRPLDIRGFKKAIQDGVGTIRVPMEGYWTDGGPGAPPPGRGPGPTGGTPSTGGRPTRPPRQPTTGPTTAGPTRPAEPQPTAPPVTPTPTKTTPPPTGGTQKAQCHLCDYTGALSTIPAHFNEAHANPAQKAAYTEQQKQQKQQQQKAKSEPTKGTAAGAGPAATPPPPVVPVLPPPAGPAAGPPPEILPPGAAGAKPRTAADYRKERFAEIFRRLIQGRPAGLSGLMEAGGKVVLAQGGQPPELRAKRGSELAKFLKEAPEGALEALVDALGKYGPASAKLGRGAAGRQAFSGGALALGDPGAGELEYGPGNAQMRLAMEIESMAKKEAERYSKRADVKAFRAAFRDRGFEAFDDPAAGAMIDKKTGKPVGLSIGQRIATANRLVDTDPGKAREMVVEAMSMIWNIMPKDAKRLFAKDPAAATTGGAGPRTRRPRNIAKGTDVVSPMAEVLGSGISAIFSKIFQASVPRREAAATAERKAMAAERRESEEAFGKAPVFGDQGEVRSTGVPGRLSGGRQGPPVPAGLFPEAPRAPLDRAGNPIVGPRPVNPFDISMLGIRGGRGPAVGESRRLSGFNPFGTDIEEQQRALRSQSRAALESLWSTPRGRTPRRAGGGPVKKGGLLDRLARQGIALPEGSYVVGEEGEEAFVPKQDGHIIDNQGQNLPAWLRRSREGLGVNKDLTGRMRQAGGPVFKGRLAAEPGSGLRGRKVIREGFEGERAAIAAGQLSPTGGVQRVFVVNWPGHLGTPATSAPPVTAAAGSFTSAQMNQILNRIGNAARAAGGQPPAAGPATPATPGGTGTATTPKMPALTLTPLEEMQRDIERARLEEAGRFRARERAADVASGVQQAATRSVPLAGGEAVAVGVGGLRGITQRRREFDEAQVQANRARTLLSKAQEELEKRRQLLGKAQTPEEVRKYTEAINEQIPAVQLAESNYAQLNERAENLSKTVITTGDKFKVFAANTVGVIGGMIGFTAILGSVQAGLTLAGDVAGPVIERMTGYQNVTAKVTGALSDQARQQGGNVEAVVAAAEAQANLSAGASELINPLLEQRVATETGNKALKDSIELIHTYQSLVASGGGLGFDRGLTQTTGGQFGTPILGTPSTAEQLGNELKNIGKQFPTAERQGLTGPGAVQGLLISDEDFSKRLAKNLEVVTKSLEVYNTELETSGTAVRITAEVNEEQYEAIRNLGIPGAKEFAASLETAQFSLENFTPTVANFQQFLQDFNTGLQTPDAGNMLRRFTAREIPNQLAAFEEEQRYQLQEAIPAQRYMDLLTAPPKPFGTGTLQIGQGTLGGSPTAIGGGANLGGFGQNAPGVDPNAAATFQQYQSVAVSALNAVTAAAREGKQALLGMGVPPGLISDMESLGATAEGLELGIANRNAAFEAAQYNRQLFQLNRNLADAQAMLGQQVGTQGRLGQLQRANFEISKQQNALQLEAQTLALGLQQRQINFQRAIAGITAPGTTPEERQARIDEAKLEADYAQKQLDIQRKMLGLGQRQFAIGVQIFDESARRQVQDLQMALAELKQGHAVQLENRAALEAINAIRARMGQITQEIGTHIEKAAKKSSAQIAMALEITNATGAAFATIIEQTGAAWQAMAAQGVKAMRSFLPGGGGGGGGGHTGGARPGGMKALASGGLFHASGASSMIVGEAGDETVAVLRNPRPSVGGAGGGSVSIVIDVHDNRLNDEGDMSRLVGRITRAVEESLNRKTALLGLKTAF